MANNKKVIKLMLAAVAMVLVIVTMIAAKKDENKYQASTETVRETLTEVIEDTSDDENVTKERNDIQERIETLTDEVAVTDFSDWEIHKAADDEPDTGETIPE